MSEIIIEKCPFCDGELYETGAPIIHVKECIKCGAHLDMEENELTWSHGTKDTIKV